jgi:creatinine amidohydrolase
MTSPAVEELIATGRVDVLVPLGSLEQHGRHLPLATDQIIAEAMASAVADRLAFTLLVAPSFPIGVSDYHLGFAGTATVPADVIRDGLLSVISSFLEGGFRHVYLLSGHAGNLPAMESAWQSLPEIMKPRVAVHGDWPAQRRAIQQWAWRNLSLEPDLVGSHSGHFETSVMLHLAPELVNMDKAEAGFVGDSSTAADTMVAQGMRAVSSTGVIGDPRSATADAGEGYFNLVVTSVVDLITSHRARGLS